MNALGRSESHLNLPFSPRYSLVGLLLLFAITVGGCGRRAGGPGPDSHIKKVTELYTSYRAANRGQQPPSEAALKQYAKSLSPQILEIMKIDDVESIFTSPRDNQPYAIAYAGRKMFGPVVAHESQGVDGKRMVATREGAVQELDEAEFRAVLAEK